ncbi:hypothetical protein HDC90_002597 [Pedobacter sp. AK013]|nr:hypothetical protein [Pedobacter sp. AK013]
MYYKEQLTYGTVPVTSGTANPATFAFKKAYNL